MRFSFQCCPSGGRISSSLQLVDDDDIPEESLCDADEDDDDIPEELLCDGCGGD